MGPVFRARRWSLLVPLGLSCTAPTTRPFFQPFPLAAFDTVPERPEVVIRLLADRLTEQRIPIRALSDQEGFLESGWFDPRTKRRRAGAANPNRAVRLRVWADLVEPQASQVVIETVYRTIADPSLPEREAEGVAPAGSAGDSVTQALRTGLRQRYAPVAPPPTPPPLPAPVPTAPQAPPVARDSASPAPVPPAPPPVPPPPPVPR